MSNVSLSFELVCLMSWLIKNEKNGINALVKLALEHGFSEKLEHLQDQEHQMAEHLYTTVMDFLLYLEQSLHKALDHEEGSQKREFLPTVKRIDGDLDSSIIWQSLQQTKQELLARQLNHQEPTEQAASSQEAEQLLLKTMLNNWSPDATDTVH